MASVPIYNVLNANPDIRAALVGTDGKLRLFGWGKAPKDTPTPYVVWQVITGLPENNLSDRPEFDTSTVQVTIYDKRSQTLESLKNEIIEAIEGYMNVVGLDGESRDPYTDDYTYTFTVDWFVNR